MMRRAGFLLLGGMLVGCTPAGPPPPPPHYVLEPSWSPGGGVWFYPHEQFAYDQTGLAGVIGAPHDRLTTDGEPYEAGAMAAQHQTLQLPAIARVTNLQTGRQVLVRINDRGPASPARLISVTPRVAELLGVPPEGGAQVRVQLDEAASRALAESMHDATADAPVTAAPRGAVQATELAPPPGARQESRVRTAATRAVAARSQDSAVVGLPPLRLPEAVVQYPPHPGQLFILGAEFGRYDYAARQAAQLPGAGARVERTRLGRTETYQLRAGPFASVAAADAALDQARRRGVTDARIVVE